MYGDPHEADPVDWEQIAKPIDFAAKSQCWLAIAGNSSKINGVEGIWAKYEPQLQKHVESVKKCQSIENYLLQSL